MNPKPSILIVDDVPENLRLLSHMLPADNFFVRPTTNGKRALEAALHTPPDLILLDIRMPDMDGFSVCAQLKAHPTLKDVPVIFISALNETEDKVKAFDAGGVDYITKPFQQREVMARVKTHLQLRQQQRELENNFQRLKALESMRDSLTQMIVHDMKSPLMAIDGYLNILELFEAEAMTPEANRYVLEARTGTARLLRMANEMLTVSKMEAGVMVLAREPVKLAELIQRVAGEFETSLEGKKLRLELAAEVPTLSLDKELIARVIQNLLGNALKFSPREGVITLALKMAGEQVEFSVQDQGTGIPPEHHAKIFEKFGQAESAHRRHGTGLGLTFCKLAMEAHGGSIGVISTVGTGSTFWGRLPHAAISAPAVNPVTN